MIDYLLNKIKIYEANLAWKFFFKITNMSSPSPSKFIVNLSIVILTFALFYFLMVSANIKKSEFDLIIQDREKFDFCLKNSRDDYLKKWEHQCSQLKQKNCDSLPGLVASQIAQEFDEDRLSCAKLYK